MHNQFEANHVQIFPQNLHYVQNQLWNSQVFTWRGRAEACKLKSMLFMVRPRCLQGLGVRPLSSEYGTYDTESSLAFQVEVLEIFQGVPSSLESGTPVGFHSQSTACMLQSRRFFLRTRRLRGCWRFSCFFFITLGLKLSDAQVCEP